MRKESSEISRFEAKELIQFTIEILTKIGVRRDHAILAADTLIRANLEGVDSHGLTRLGIYCQRMNENRINPRPKIQFFKKGPSVLTVNGDNGLGHIVGSEAITRGIGMAKETGMAGITVNNSNHFGTASYYCQMACDHNLAALAFTNSPSGIPPWGGRQAFFGTNPIAFGFPTGDDVPVIIDLSTSVVARGKIIAAEKQGNRIPDGWAIDENGDMTNDAAAALRGAVLPLGGAKGSALALAVEILTGVLTGAAFGPNVTSIYQDEKTDRANVGHFFILIDIEKFMPIEEFNRSMGELLQVMKNIPKVPGTDEIRYPGERRKREYDRRMNEGIPLPEQVVEELILLGEIYGIRFPNNV